MAARDDNVTAMQLGELADDLEARGFDEPVVDAIRQAAADRLRVPSTMGDGQSLTVVRAASDNGPADCRARLFENVSRAMSANADAPSHTISSHSVEEVASGRWFGEAVVLHLRD